MGNEGVPWEGVRGEEHRGYTWRLEEYFEHYGRPLAVSALLFMHRNAFISVPKYCLICQSMGAPFVVEVHSRSVAAHRGKIIL